MNKAFHRLNICNKMKGIYTLYISL